MEFKLYFAILLTNFLLLARGQIDFGEGFTLHKPCKGNETIYYKYSNGQPKDNEYLFFVYLDEVLPANTIVNMTFVLPSERIQADLGAEMTLVREEVIDFVLLEKQNNLNFSLRTIDKKTPYLGSVLVNNVEKCPNPIRELDEIGQIPASNPLGAQKRPSKTQNCGRRKVIKTPLIVGGETSKEGDWPWHVALSVVTPNSKQEYICGGTLISPSMVLTAAHCVTESGQKLVPSRLRVELGKYKLYENDKTLQVLMVNRIIVHEKFNYNSLENDIALLELNLEITFNDHIQPACLWRPLDSYSLPTSEINGTVVGWGLFNNRNLSEKLQQISLPKVTDIECIKSNALFFENALNGKNFCAGYHNETHPRSACNGDSGGGYVVLIPDIPGDKSRNAVGSWHVRGVTSQAVARENEKNCDPAFYSVFTDVMTYLDWIDKYVI